MYVESTPAAGATLTFAAATRGGGGAAIGLLIGVRIASVGGSGNAGLTADIKGAPSNSVSVAIGDTGGITVGRNNSVGTLSDATGTGLTAGDRFVWVDIPTAMLAGTNPTVYQGSLSDAWNAVTMTGADSPAGTANDMNGAITLTLGPSAVGNWGVGPVYVWRGANRPTTAAAARDVALGGASAASYTGLCFAAPLVMNFVDFVSNVPGSNAGGRLNGASVGARRRTRSRRR